jgi:hypothetical protein
MRIAAERLALRPNPGAIVDSMTDQRIPVPDSELKRIAGLTAMMRHKEAELADLAEKRQDMVVKLSNGDDIHKPVTYDRLAEAMGISAVAVYKIKRKGGPPLRERGIR